MLWEYSMWFTPRSAGPCAESCALPHSTMRQNALIALAAAALGWSALATVLGSWSLQLLSGSRAPGRSACLADTREHMGTLPATGVEVSPAPHTSTANPHTQISFRGVPMAALRQISVVGGRSGEHPGRLRGYSQGDGASFVPRTPFDAGEQVNVRIVLYKGTITRRIAFRFVVATEYPTANAEEFPNPPAAPADYESFYTLPSVRAPILTVTVPDRDPAAGDILTTNGPGPGQYGPLIYTPQGRLVWFQNLPPGEAAKNLTEQTYDGQPVLTWWKGRVLSLGFGQGEDIVMNSRYQTIARITGANGLRPDLHDFRIAPRGVAYVTAYNPIRCDLSAVNGSRDGAITDNVIQQIDMRTGLVRWEWHSLDHVAAAESEVEAPTDATPWDYFHINSVDPQPDGNLLISARSTWAAYLVQGASGKILWRLGGSNSSFKMGPGTRTAWQHDGRVLPNGELSFFDNGSNPPIHRQSRAVRIKLDLKAHEAHLVSAFTHSSPPLLSASQGNVQTLADGKTLVGYGTVPAISEFAKDGTLLFDAHEPYDTSFYRAFRFAWRARPSRPPVVIASLNSTGEETTVHASWNGATDVSSWRVLAGAQRRGIRPQTEMRALGFESSTTLPEKYAYVAVQALDAAGRVLGTSRAAAVMSYAASLGAVPGGP